MSRCALRLQVGFAHRHLHRHLQLSPIPSQLLPPPHSPRLLHNNFFRETTCFARIACVSPVALLRLSHSRVQCRRATLGSNTDELDESLHQSRQEGGARKGRMAPMKVDPTKVREFQDFQTFYDWLEVHHANEDELWIKIHKVKSGKPSITPKEAIDAELCWGWVDGIRKGFDETSFLQRYTPRRKRSVWSQVNRVNVERLTAEGLMRPAGQAEVDLAKADGRWDAAYSSSKTQAPEDLLAAIAEDPAAAAFYRTLSSQNRFALSFRTLSLKTEAGRKRKIAAFVEMLRKGETIYPQGKGKSESEDGAENASIARKRKKAKK